MNKKKKLILLTAICFFSVVLITLFINLYMIGITKEKILDIKKLNDNYDVIIILGCKVYEDNTPSLMLVKRLEKGIDVYNMLNTKVLLTGDNTRNDYNEVVAMREYLLNSSIPESDIILDYAGISTYDSIYRAKYIFKAKKAVIITQKYHMYRALYLANKLDLEAVGVVADDIPQKYIMLKNEIREILSRDKNFLKGIIKPKSKYLEDVLPINS